MYGASASGGIELAQPPFGMLFEVAILSFFLLRGGKKMLHIVDFRHNGLHKCAHSGVGAHAGEGVFGQPHEGFAFAAVDAEMQMLVVGIEHEVTPVFAQVVAASGVFEREMFDGHGTFAHIEAFVFEHIFDKDVARGVIYVGGEGDVGGHLAAGAGYTVIARGFAPFIEDAGFFEEVADGLLAVVEREGFGVFGHESEHLTETMGFAFEIGVFVSISVEHTVIFRVFAEEEFEVFVFRFGTNRFHHVIVVAHGGNNVVSVDIEKKIIHVCKGESSVSCPFAHRCALVHWRCGRQVGAF